MIAKLAPTQGQHATTESACAHRAQRRPGEAECIRCQRPHAPLDTFASAARALLLCASKAAARLACGLTVRRAGGGHLRDSRPAPFEIYAFAVQSAPKHSSKVALFFLSSCFVEMCVSSCWRLAVALNVCEQHANV